VRFKQIRNATILIEFAGKRFLVDPMLSEKGGFPGFEGTVNSHISNPTVDLPVPVSEMLDVDAVIVTHTHPDHWDDAAKSLVPKDTLLFAQNAKDAEEIRGAGFRNVRALEETTEFDGITMIKTHGQHGRGKALEGPIGEILGQVSGIVFKHRSEKTLYVAGDTVWYRGVDESLKKHDPDVVVLNSGDAKILPDDSIIMSKQDIHEVYKAAPRATIIASHMEAVNHATLSRRELREFLVAHGMTQRVLIPADGEAYSFEPVSTHE
jgi:L-ascorbate metabolism protein UlaG (beta-lactamase superfamily)